ncbi:MAG: agarase [Verrucomicrobiia bacterium]
MRTISQLVYFMAALTFLADQTRATAATNLFFHAVQVDGRWWLVDPDGHHFISKGVTTVQFAQDTIQGTNVSPYRETNKVKYGNPTAWRKAVAQRLIGWGFNTLGAWSDSAVAEITVSNRHLAYAPIVDLGAGFVGQKQKGQAWLHGIFPDAFDPDFETFARQRAREVCTPLTGDVRVLGWFTDNELRWGPDWRGPDELLTMFLDEPANVPGKKAAVSLLQERYHDVSKFNAVWNTKFTTWEDVLNATSIAPPVVRPAVYKQNEETERQANEADPKRAAFVADCDAFLARLADRYFRVTDEAIKAADPNHMNFGARFAYFPPQPVVAAAAKYVDVVSFNCYQPNPRATVERYAAFGKPLIIGEFSFRSEDSGLPNSRGAGPKVKTQTERAAAFRNYVTQALQNPNLVGYHWFEHCDEPKEGRFDGENSNYGVVNIHDDVYTELTQTMTDINAQAEALHEGNR